MSVLFLDAERQKTCTIIYCGLMRLPVLSVVFVLGYCFWPHFSLSSLQLCDTPLVTLLLLCLYFLLNCALIFFSNSRLQILF